MVSLGLLFIVATVVAVVWGPGTLVRGKKQIRDLAQLLSAKLQIRRLLPSQRAVHVVPCGTSATAK